MTWRAISTRIYLRAFVIYPFFTAFYRTELVW